MDVLKLMGGRWSEGEGEAAPGWADLGVTGELRRSTEEAS